MHLPKVKGLIRKQIKVPIFPVGMKKAKEASSDKRKEPKEVRQRETHKRLDPEDVKKKIGNFVTAHRGAGIYGYPGSFEISGKEYTLPRKFFYYIHDRRLHKGMNCSDIWERIDGKWHFCCAIPEVYLKQV